MNIDQTIVRHARKEQAKATRQKPVTFRHIIDPTQQKSKTAKLSRRAAVWRNWISKKKGEQNGPISATSGEVNKSGN